MEYVFSMADEKPKPYADGQQVNKLLNSQSMNKAKISKDFCNRVVIARMVRATTRTRGT